MRRKNLNYLLIIAIIAFGSYSISKSIQKDTSVNEVALANVEALTQDESTSEDESTSKDDCQMYDVSRTVTCNAKKKFFANECRKKCSSSCDLSKGSGFQQVGEVVQIGSFIYNLIK